MFAYYTRNYNYTGYTTVTDRENHMHSITIRTDNDSMYVRALDVVLNSSITITDTCFKVDTLVNDFINYCANTLKIPAEELEQLTILHVYEYRPGKYIRVDYLDKFICFIVLKINMPSVNYPLFSWSIVLAVNYRANIIADDKNDQVDSITT